jgi:hypothetical protein
MSSDLWIGALTTLSGTALGGVISFVLSRQQLYAARARSAEDAVREKNRRSEDRRYDAYANFYTEVRNYRNALRHSYHSESTPQQIVAEAVRVATKADATAPLVYLVQESQITRDACQNVTHTIARTLNVIVEHKTDPEAVPWIELSEEISGALSAFLAASRTELGLQP